MDNHLNVWLNSFRAGNLVSASMNTEASSDVTSSGPVKLSDLQRILSNIGSTGSVDYFPSNLLSVISNI